MKQVIGSYIECASGSMTCTGGNWGACEADGLTNVVPLSDLGTQALATDAGPCEEPCNPYCARYRDTPDGIALPADGGLRLTDAGLTLEPNLPSGATCTQLVIAGAPTSVTVTGIAPLVRSPANIPFTATFLPAGCASPGTQPSWVVDRPGAATISQAGLFEVVDGVATTVTVRAFFATSSTVLTSNAVPVTVVVRGKTEGRVFPNGAPTASAVDRFFTDATHTAYATPTIASDVSWLYPYADTYFPLGLLPPPVQYKMSANPGATVKVSLRYPVGATPTTAQFDYAFFVAEGSNFYPNPDNFAGSAARTSLDGQAVVPGAVWRAFEQTAKSADAEIVIQRVVGTALQQETRRRIHFVDGQLKGTVYYGSYNSPLGGNTGATLAIRPGASAPVVAAQNSGRCTVCHSLNAKGDYLMVNGNNSGGYSYSVAARYDTGNNGSLVQSYTNGGRFVYGGASPDGSFYMSHRGDSNWHASGDPSRLYRTSDAAAVALTNWPNDVSAVSPTFSKDARKIAFGFWAGTRIQSSGPTASNARIVVADFNCNAVDGVCGATPWSVTNPRDLTPSQTAVAGWPSFLPDSNVVLYQRVITSSTALGGWSPSHINTIGGAQDEIWGSTVPATSATAAVTRRLDRLNGYESGVRYLPTTARDVAPLRPAFHTANASVAWHTDGCSGPFTTNNVNDTTLNYLPRANPQEAGGVYWVVFTSRRMFGNVAWDNPWASRGTGSCRGTEVPTQKLWVAAIDKNWNGVGDPSHPAFYLPGQELLAGNSKGYWVDSPCSPTGATCDTTDDCCQSPTVSECRVQTGSTPLTRRCEAASACRGSGQSCMMDSDCCGNGARCLGVSGPNPGVCSLNQTFTSATYTREYTSTCPAAGERPIWQLFRWQAIVPSGTNITFSAQTATLTGAWGASVPVGTATATTTGWTSGPQTVDAALMANGQRSESRLRITMVLNGNGTAAPTLTQWDQLFDCQPAE